MIPVKDAYDNLLRRTLSKIPGDLGKLIYLASTRDYNSGRYHHDGLAARFSPIIAAEALEAAHRDVFYRVAAYSLKELVLQMHIYVQSSHESQADVIRAWETLQPYRIAMPMNINPSLALLFISNIKLALAILPRLPAKALSDLSISSPRP